jgi:uncharacterized protein YneF (UPF0154 family)
MVVVLKKIKEIMMESGDGKSESHVNRMRATISSVIVLRVEVP